MDKELSRILDESIQLELNVADLYLSFCHAFAEDKGFWSQLAEEEGNHAALLRSGKLESLDEGHFPAKILTTNLDALIKVNKEIKELLKEASRSRRCQEPPRLRSPSKSRNQQGK